MEKISKFLLSGNNLAYTTSIMVAIFIFLYIVYNALSFVILKERYHGIRFTTKNIAYITMFTAVSVSLTVVISLTIPITVFPPIRVAFEGIMVKITGYIFGPIVGIIVGLITELLVMIFVPSYIHPAFTIVVVSFGFISGIGASFLRAGKGNNLFIYLLIIAFFVIFAAFMSVLIKFNNKDIPILGKWSLSSKGYMIFFIGSISLTLLVISIVAWILFIKKKRKVLNTLLPIILFASVCEFISTTLISAWGDSAFLGLGKEGYSAMVISRLAQAPFKILFNTTVLYFAYQTVAPLIKKDR